MFWLALYRVIDLTNIDWQKTIYEIWYLTSTMGHVQTIGIVDWQHSLSISITVYQKHFGAVSLENLGIFGGLFLRANRNPWAGYRLGSPQTPRHPNPQPGGGGRKVSISNCSQPVGDRRKQQCQENTCENKRCHEQPHSPQLSPKPPSEWTRIEHNSQAAWSPLWWWPCFSQRFF